jgi:alpha-glucosidase
MLGVSRYQAEIKELGTPQAEALAYAARFSRDRCRTPMQWSARANAGFSPPDVQTWLPVNSNYTLGVNVASQLADPASLLNFYRRVLRWRKQTPALIAGDYTPLHDAKRAEDYLAFLRHSEANGQTCLIVLNMSNQSHSLRFDLDGQAPQRVFSSHTRAGDADTLSQLSIAPFEIYIAELA